MAMAEKPEIANQRRQHEGSASNDGSAPLRRVYEAKDDSPAEVIALRNQLRGLHRAGYQRVFQILEMVCGTDRMYDRARKQLLDVMNDHEKAMIVLVNRSLLKETEKVEETTNA